MELQELSPEDFEIIEKIKSKLKYTKKQEEYRKIDENIYNQLDPNSIYKILSDENVSKNQKNTIKEKLGYIGKKEIQYKWDNNQLFKSTIKKESIPILKEGFDLSEYLGKDFSEYPKDCFFIQTQSKKVWKVCLHPKDRFFIFLYIELN